MVKIDLERVNAEAPYKLESVPYASLFYSLKTDYEVDYALGFMPNELLPGVDAYEFIISNTNNRKSPRDLKLRQTILALLYEFFRQPEAVLIYLCETGDNRQSYRNRLFESWFHTSSRQRGFAYFSADIMDEEGIMNYVALVIRVDHPRFSWIASRFGEAVQLLRRKPER